LARSGGEELLRSVHPAKPASACFTDSYFLKRFTTPRPPIVRVVTIIDVVFCNFFDGFSGKLVA
jgi:hypothetical protein